MANGHCRNIDLLATPRIPSSNIKPRIKDYDQLFQADPNFGNKARQEEQVQISSNVRAAMAFVAEKVAPLSSESFSNQSSQEKIYPQTSEEALSFGDKKMIQAYGIPF